MVSLRSDGHYLKRERYEGGDTGGILNMQGGPDPEWARLRAGITTSRRQKEGFRKRRFEFISEYVGARYSYYGARDKVPANMLALMVSTFRRFLGSSNPQIKASTKYARLKPQALNLEIALNLLLDEIDFEMELEQCILEAIFLMGMMKIGQSPYGNLDIEGELVPVGEPYAMSVDFDDLVFDMSARRFRDVQFIGDRIRAPIIDLIDSGRFAGNEHRFIIADDRYYDETGQELVRKIDTGNDYDHERAVDYTEYYEIYRPRHNDIVVFLCDDLGLPTGDPVEQKPWVGPPSYEGSIGPYHPLGFDPVPNNPVPVSPVALLFDLHDLANVMYRKVNRQGLRQKQITGVRSGKVDDGNNILSAPDGEMVRLDDPRNINQMELGGFNPNNMQLFIHQKQLFSYLGGNLDLLAGLAPQSETLGQDEILAGGSSRKMADMQQSVLKFTKGCCRALAWWYWHNPLKTMTGEKTVPGTPISVPFEHTPEMRQGGLHRFGIDIEPYSLVHRTPQGRLNDMLAIYERVILPMLPMLQQFGMGFDFVAFIEQIADLSNLPELREVMMLLPQDVPPAAQGQGADSRQSPFSKRVYERVNRPGSTMRGQEEVLMNNMMGKRMQFDQEAAFGRPMT